MRRLAQLFFPFLLYLGKIKVAAFCDKECRFVNNVTVTETTISIEPPDNFTISKVTFQNGSDSHLLGNDSVYGLHPGVQYQVYFSNTSETCCKNISTKPSPVYDILTENINTTTLDLSWKNNDINASNYTYRICIDGPGRLGNISSDTTKVHINGLYPGTLNRFKIYAQLDDGKTEGNASETSVYTKPSPVSDIQTTYSNSTTVVLTWKNDDTYASGYIYQISIRGPDFHDTFSNTNNISFSDLQPGTLYSFDISAQVNNTNTTGDTKKISFYSKPSMVYDIQAENISTTTVDLSWKNNDTNSSNYTYRVHTDGPGLSGDIYSNTTNVQIIALQPGTLYKFKIYAQADDGNTEGDPNGIDVYTKPSPVYGIQAENISTTTLDLSWKNDDTNASNYIYQVHIGGPVSSDNISSDAPKVQIRDLQPGTLYRFQIYAHIDGGKTEGDPKGINVYTKPSPVYDIQAENITNTTLDLKWKNNDTNASNYTCHILINEDIFKNVTCNTAYLLVSGLQPGTLYRFTIYAQVDDAMTGDPNQTSVYTKPSPVFDIILQSISNTIVNLTWNNSDPNALNYTYRIDIEGNYNQSDFFSTTSAAISGLEPGTLYEFKIYAQVDDGKTEGDPNGINVYTKPSSVFNITVTDVSTTVVNISWESPDRASPTYSYRILINGGLDKNKTFLINSTEISELVPGTNYIFSIYAIAADNKTEGNPKNITHCTNPASVSKLDCSPVAKQPELSLNWSIPEGHYEGFRIDILNSDWNKTFKKEYRTIVTNLAYFTAYTIRIVTCSCGKVSIPQDKTCRTSITDPPPLSKPPDVMPTSHNSLNVHFSSVSSSHGPIKAYAVIISTPEGIVSNESLKYTYNDFITKKTRTYVAYVKAEYVQTEQQRSSFSTNNQDYVIEIGNGSTTYGYFNGKLDPLGSYRACVAAFTYIVILNESISSENSYVSFSSLSQTIVLPQNPDVITGAVVGCILALVVTVAILAFVFWKKKRKAGNNEVPFTQIEPKKSKLLKVENYESYFKKQKADSNCGFAGEYEDLRLIGANQPKFAAELPENRGKNRYNNVLPYDISRVKLSFQTHPTNDYINANYIPGYNSKKEFIAAQGPLPNTVQDFWRMVWEKKIYTVVMLTKCIEQARTKCEEYWPNKQSKNCGDIIIAMTSEIVLPEWTIRDFSMQKSDSPESHPVRQFHFTSWPDHGVPETTDLLISFRHLIHEYIKQNPPTSPTLVHCSAGVGRTGTFIAIDRLIHQMEMENTVDVYGVVYDLRMHRSLMVQTEDQYVFLNHCVMDIIKSKKEKKADLIYQNTDAMAIYENFTPSPSIGKANGYHV